MISLLVMLLVIAAFLRDDFALTLIYLFVGTFLLSGGWVRRALGQVTHVRSLDLHAFVGEKVPVRLDVHNQGWLPLPWLEVRDSLPVALATPAVFRRIVTLGPRGRLTFEYVLEARKRGYYAVGPLFLASSDVLGIGQPLQVRGQVQYLTVYPKIVPLARVGLPASAPQGTLRHTQPVFEDPTRVIGKREYTPGDSLRRVDWKSTAASGRMQVKVFEPSIALETMIVLDMNAENYHYHSRIDSTELAVVIAASLANWVIEKKQTCGLAALGRDPLSADGQPQPVPPRKGKAHLMRLLETLARVEMVQGGLPLAASVQRIRYGLAWGATLMVITGQPHDALLDELYQARRAGQHVMLVLAGPGAPVQAVRHKAAFLGIPVASVFSEQDLQQWQA